MGGLGFSRVHPYPTRLTCRSSVVAFFLVARARRSCACWPIVEVMFLSVILSSLGRWLRSRETARQLSALSDRELSDIGLSRGDIYQAARQGR
jgi:uncharacterized protein YjiS (DUF1127 family)